ncbi:hypothetical protein K523DRAFT_253205 [Schizophyllum commune Tattone D]|nr:hypothetical protein K523DRAFT_253205 [Schizophyllum commune Tattone D]
MVCFQSVASNANFGVPALETGGNWKKSPVTMTLYRACPMRASLSKRSPSTMDTEFG